MHTYKQKSCLSCVLRVKKNNEREREETLLLQYVKCNTCNKHSNKVENKVFCIMLGGLYHTL